MTIRPLHEKVEREWDRDLFGKKGLATMLGWESQWTFLSKGSRAGFPDRTLCRDRVIFAELKRELTGRKSDDYNRHPSSTQIAWLDRLARAGAEVYLWRPSDLEEIARVLSKRWAYRPGAHPVLMLRTEWFTPASLWVPGLGRWDTGEQTDLLKTEVIAAA